LKKRIIKEKSIVASGKHADGITPQIRGIILKVNNKLSLKKFLLSIP
jgi:hypothetical protein